MKLYIKTIPTLLNNKFGFALLRAINPDYKQGWTKRMGVLVVYDYPVLKIWKDDVRFIKWDSLPD